ncbi:MAG TPA: SRPBCC domain-containing protein [Trebonia sp.]
MTDHQAGRQVIRVAEFLHYPDARGWRVLTSADLVARWLMVDDFRLEPGFRLPIATDPIRQVGMRGAGQFEVLAFEEATMLRISWKVAGKEGHGLNSVVTFTLAPEGAGTRLLIEHDGRHPCGIFIGAARLTTRGCHTSVRSVGEVQETTGAWRACVRRIGDLLSATA